MMARKLTRGGECGAAFRIKSAPVDSMPLGAQKERMRLQFDVKEVNVIVVKQLAEYA